MPAGIRLARRGLPRLGVWSALDVAAPVLVASWAVGRLLACQFEVAGGGPPTSAWYGLHYAGQAGARVPVPLFQSAENWVLFALLLGLERRLGARRHAAGVVAAAAASGWGASRVLDQWLWFARSPDTGAVLTLAAAGGLALAGLAALVALVARRRGDGQPERADCHLNGPDAVTSHAHDEPEPTPESRLDRPIPERISGSVSHDPSP